LVADLHFALTRLAEIDRGELEVRVTERTGGTTLQADFA
jgi:hypothetical protein